MARWTLSPSRGKSASAKARRRRWLPPLVVCGALFFTALACGAPENWDGQSSSIGGGPHYACATATPSAVPIIATDPVSKQPTYAPTSTTPTATPYAKSGEFYEGQPVALNTTWQIALRKTEQRGDYALLTFGVKNNGGTEAAVTLSMQLFIQTADGATQHYDPEGQKANGLLDVVEMEAEPIPAGMEIARTYAFAGLVPDKTGLNTDVFGNAGKPIWFRSGEDPALIGVKGTLQDPCRYGPASFTDMQAPQGQYASSPYVGGGQYPLQGVEGVNWIISSRFGAHHGLDLATTAKAIGGKIGSPIYSPIAGIVEVAGTSVNELGMVTGYGNYVVIRAAIGGNDFIWMYFAHMDTLPAVGKGQKVGCWSYLGPTGTTGNSSGPHLHWEVRRGKLRSDSPELSRYGANQFDPDLSRAYWGFTCAQKAQPTPCKSGFC